VRQMNHVLDGVHSAATWQIRLNDSACCLLVFLPPWVTTRPLLWRIDVKKCIFTLINQSTKNLIPVDKPQRDGVRRNKIFKKHTRS